MPDYSKGKIYTIRFHNTNEIYIGSTTQSLAVRFGGHKRGGSIKCSLYKLINSKYNGDWSVCYYELYENYSCNNKEELCKKEGELIRLFKNDENYNCINCRIAGRTDIEYDREHAEIRKENRKNNPDIFKKRDKDYYENNKEKINERKKEKITCACGLCIAKGNLADHIKTKKHQNYLSLLPTIIDAGYKSNS
jgi:hypothetical protein